MTQLPAARAAALDCLCACLLEGRDLQAALDAALTSDPLSDRDAGLVTELVYGYCRMTNTATNTSSRMPISTSSWALRRATAPKAKMPFSSTR